jgi:hypothetical protein
MPSGHTERETINQRRPLTRHMIDLLKVLASSSPRMHWVELTTPEKNILRALSHRGLVTGQGEPRLTDAGREALASCQ